MKKESKARVYLVDKQGLLFSDTEGLTDAQAQFVHERSEFENESNLTNLTAAVHTIRPSILIRTSTQPQSFTQEIVEDICEAHPRPILFTLSNPTKLVEAKAGLVNDTIISAASHALGGLVDPTEQDAAVLPPVRELASISNRIAVKAVEATIGEGLAGEEVSSPKDAVAKTRWTPAY